MPKKQAAPSTAMTKWDEKLAELAKLSKKTVNAISSGGNFISLKGGNITFQGAAMPEKKMNVIVVDWVLHNLVFEGAYSEEDIQSPMCYSFGRAKEEMAPNPEDVESPVNETCNGCEYNQWGTADVGRGKKCSETARLALIAEADFDEIESAQEAYLKVPTTSMAFWAGYVRELETAYNRPPLAFVTEISIEPQTKLPGWHVAFKLVQPLEEAEQIEALMGRYDVISKKIAFPYPKLEQIAPAPKPSNPAKVTRAKPMAPVVAAKKGVKAPRF